ncbi:protein phosphatase 2C domain-containing protein [Micromonospora sp. WMMD710]|uniref:PP2C family protein-serine/threonine phosphatase n=1 Tax=Micromonospora sp. WMMD710 TaxID=3016085 RepID=UPI0024173F55|nr:protein phosphatase 2C domain-containing protein [Micromonospora sp. WMMD710]MDG4757700.1 protein phosphatase 2C domain-containing protein [Micromonospora sp. WMMD710]
MTVIVEAASRTHQGLVRRRNEDSHSQGQWLFVVADGLGGHVAGDIASSTVTTALAAYDRPVPAKDLANFLGQAIYQASEALRRKVRADPELAGMGTTLVALLCSGSEAVVANVGDSRAYLIRRHGSRDSAMLQISEDHTYQHLVANADKVPNLGEKLARFLDGRNDGRSPDLTPLHLQPGDRILLCSDGLSSYVPGEQIRAALDSDGSPGDIADQLVTVAVNQGGHDNITVIVIDVAQR